ncbi:hypothetical protein BG015_008587 [Linnemannia schmuckeri]|uniref:Uncharacterized protein n=1 Tax=Linnemannia schmuckeri TaxID=64567 RepID=A0A9P5RWQ8_9FUNG|nr:hypothetical protein BG015_008587 [Linnemannia schmuckeri]
MNKFSSKDYCLSINVKLHLDDRYSVQRLPNGITRQQAISNYLMKLNKYIVPSLQKNLSVTERRRNDRFQYCLTVPGHWSNQAKDTMRQAAINTGLVQTIYPPHRLTLISEEEAMAIYSLHMTADDNDLEGDRFMLCHAPEGESVTLVVYEVTKSVGQTQQLEEVARNFGPSCGSDFLAANMERLVERKLRNYRHIITADEWEGFMATFEMSIRSTFDGVEDQFLHVDTLAESEISDKEAGVDDEGYLVLSAAELKDDVFEPVVVDVVELIQDMLQRGGRNCKALFMLGEFGSSQYMWERIKQEFYSQIAFISRPPRPELAISRGAVFAGLDSYTKT